VKKIKESMLLDENMNMSYTWMKSALPFLRFHSERYVPLFYILVYFPFLKNASHSHVIMFVRRTKSAVDIRWRLNQVL